MRWARSASSRSEVFVESREGSLAIASRDAVEAVNEAQLPGLNAREGGRVGHDPADAVVGEQETPGLLAGRDRGSGS